MVGMAARAAAGDARDQAVGRLAAITCTSLHCAVECALKLHAPVWSRTCAPPGAMIGIAVFLMATGMCCVRYQRVLRHGPRPAGALPILLTVCKHLALF